MLQVFGKLDTQYDIFSLRNYIDFFVSDSRDRTVDQPGIDCVGGLIYVQIFWVFQCIGLDEAYLVERVIVEEKWMIFKKASKCLWIGAEVVNGLEEKPNKGNYNSQKRNASFTRHRNFDCKITGR